MATIIDHLEQFRAFIQRLCETDVGTPVADGKWHRFRVADTRHKGSKPGAYLLHVDNGRPNGIFVDWRNGDRHKWFADGPVEKVDRSELAAKRKQRRDAIYAGFVSASADALGFWKVCSHRPEGSHPYLDAKRIGFNGARLGTHPAFGLDGLLLVIPIRNIDPKLATLQAIAADGSRRFFKGTTHEGGYTVIGDLAKPGPIAFAEGFSTGVTIHDATGWAVIVCITAGNMERIARWASHAHAGRNFIVCGDDDVHLVAGGKENIGRKKASHAALILGARLVFPDLQGADGSDFNDQEGHYGIDDVRATLLDVLDQPEPEPAQDFDTATVDDNLAGAIEKLGFDIRDWSTDQFLGPAPEIEWLIEGVVPLGSPGMIASLGGLGKSYKVIDIGLEIAVEVAGAKSNRKVLGGAVKHHGNVVILNAEDNRASIHRRLEKIDPGEVMRRAGKGRIFIVPLPAAGGPKPLIHGGQPPVRTEFFHALMTQLESVENLALVIADPLQAFIAADVTSDPAAAQFMWSAFAELCARKGATFIFTHHMRKDGSAKIATAEDAREAIRGVTALVDGSRFAYCFWAANEDDGRMICQQAKVEYAPRKVVYGAVVKANDEHDNSIHTYIRAPSGLLEDASEFGRRVQQSASGLTVAQARHALTEVDRRWHSQNPFSKAHNSGGRHFGKWLEIQFGLTKKVAREQLDQWISSEILVEDLCVKHLNLKGLYVENWPEDVLEEHAKVRERRNHDDV